LVGFEELEPPSNPVLPAPQPADRSDDLDCFCLKKEKQRAGARHGLATTRRGRLPVHVDKRDQLLDHEAEQCGQQNQYFEQALNAGGSIKVNQC